MRNYRVKPYPETHQEGIISIENLDLILKQHSSSCHVQLDESEQLSSRIGGATFKGDLGVQIASDGRVWICIDRVVFIRFSRTEQ